MNFIFIYLYRFSESDRKLVIEIRLIYLFLKYYTSDSSYHNGVEQLTLNITAYRI
jgi:hypothetical protein